MYTFLPITEIKNAVTFRIELHATIYLSPSHVVHQIFPTQNIILMSLHYLSICPHMYIHVHVVSLYLCRYIYMYMYTLVFSCILCVNGYEYLYHMYKGCLYVYGKYM